MASDINKVILIGRLTRDPELRHTPSFFNCVAWGKLGETISQWVKKGHRIGIEGRLMQRTWEDKDGNRRQAVEIVIENMQFLQPKDKNQAAADPAQASEPAPDNGLGSEVPSAPAQTTAGSPFADDDIPF